MQNWQAEQPRARESRIDEVPSVQTGVNALQVLPRAALEELAHDLQVARQRGAREGGESVAEFGVNVGARVEEEAEEQQVAMLGRLVEWRPPPPAWPCPRVSSEADGRVPGRSEAGPGQLASLD